MTSDRQSMADLQARITELERANAALEEADRRKNEFLALLGHELRNPLAAVAASVELLEMAETDPADLKRAREVLHRQVYHLTRLVDDLLDVACVLRGKIRLEKKPADLVAIVNDALAAARPMLTAKRRRLHVALPASLPVEGDAARLGQAFANLLDNAAKFTKADGQIWVQAETGRGESGSSGLAMVKIRDDGTGMSPDLVPRVFDLFATATPSQEGGADLGLGLSLVRRLVRLHGGSVEARSDGPGKGSEFVVSLPLAPVASNGVAESQTPVSQLPTRRILLVDDNVDTTESLARLLRYVGQDVCVAHDGAAALEQAGHFAPEIVLLDIGLPGLDGYEVARRLRKQPGMDKVLLLALTGYSLQDEGQRMREAGFDDHLLKPVTLKTIEKLLKSGTTLDTPTIVS